MEKEKQTDDYRREIELCDGKYKWIYNNYRLTCLRYGEKWRDETGDYAIVGLIEEIADLKTEIKRLRSELNYISDCRYATDSADAKLLSRRAEQALQTKEE